MLRNHRDDLNDIVAYAEVAIEIVTSGDERSVLVDRALGRVLEVVGEAAGRIPGDGDTSGSVARLGQPWNSFLAVLPSPR